MAVKLHVVILDYQISLDGNVNEVGLDFVVLLFVYKM